jgi:Spy/CpxP family protein refolding chaperone
MSDPAVPTMTPGRSRRVAGLIMLLVALGGGVAGVAVDRLVLLPWHFRDRPFGPMGRGGPPERMEHRAREHFAHELGLSDSQRVRIDSLMERQMQQLRAVRGQVQPQLDSIVTQTRRSIDSILTPEQRERAQTMLRRFREGPFGWRGEAGGPGGRGRPGGPGGEPPPPPDH